MALQRAHFCRKVFSIIRQDKTRENVAKLQLVNIWQVENLTRELDFLLEWCMDRHASNDAGDDPHLSTSATPLILDLCSNLFPFPFTAESLNNDYGLVKTVRLLVHILDLGVVCYTCAHISNCLQDYLQIDSSAIDILAPFEEALISTDSLSITLQLCHFQCLDSFHQGKPAWVFASTSRPPQERLLLSARMQAIADIWGPLWKAKS